MLVLRRDICFLGVLPIQGFAACGDVGCGTTPAPGTSLALPDPTPGAVERFNQQEVIPADLNHSSFASLNGAVCQYILHTHTLFADIFGEEAERVGPIPQYTGLSWV